MATQLLRAFNFDNNNAFAPVVVTMDWTGVEAIATGINPVAGVFRNLIYRVPSTPTDPGDSKTLILRVNGSNTSLAATVTNPDVTGQDTTNSATVAAGDLLVFNHSTVGGPGLTTTSHVMEFEATDSREMGFVGPRIALATSGTTYIGALLPVSDATLSEAQNVLPLAGEFTGHFFYSRNAITGGTWTIYLNINGTRQDGTGGTTDTALAVTGTGPWSRTDYAISASPGDIVYFEAVVTAGTPSPGASPSLSLSSRFKASVAGKGIMCGRGTPSNLSVNYAPINYGGGLSTTEVGTNSYAGISSWTLSKLYMLTSVAPGAGNSWGCDVYKNGSATGVAITVSDAATSGSDTANSASFADGDLVTFRTAPSSGPAAAILTWSFVADFGGGGGGGTVGHAEFVW